MYKLIGRKKNARKAGRKKGKNQGYLVERKEQLK